MAGPAATGAIAAVYFDGLSARRQEVSVLPAPDGQGLELRHPDGSVQVWPLAQVRQLGDRAGRDGITLTLHADTGDESVRDPARLTLTDPEAIRWISAQAPHLHRRDLRQGTGWKLARRAGLALVAVGAILFVILPRLSDFLATRVPAETEIAFGKSVRGQIEWMLAEDGQDSLTCSTPAGDAALAQLSRRLTEGQSLPFPVEMTVLDHPMVNAFAAPGGQVVILRGLLDQADGPDEVAAVLAHELGHVAARDPMRLAMRSAGSAGILSILLGDMTGGALIALLGEQVLTASYTREAEAAADDFAHAMLDRAAISSLGMAGFFDRIAATNGIDLPAYLSTHPASAERADRARERAGHQTNTTPALAPQEWQALRAICNG
jgi:Zn-dependent protease with chaperone function